MDRKRFIGGGLGMVFLGSLMRHFATASPIISNNEDGPVIIPPYLKKGDVIAIVSPAGTITREDIQPAIDQLMEWGYQVKVGSSIGKKDFTFGGTDADRIADLQSMLDDDSVRAIMCARGGYGLVRIIDGLSFEKFVSHPKWIIGFSDACVLHYHIHGNFRIATLHSKMCNSFLKDKSKLEPVQIESITSINDCLRGNGLITKLNPNINNRIGESIGVMIGGNLSILENISGTSSDFHTEGKILFLEDTEEYLYNIDRMFWNLKRTGKLKALKGLIIGGFKIKPDDPGEEFGLTLEQIILEKVKDYNYPVCFDFPVGHQKYNVALVCGGTYSMKVDKGNVSLQKI